MGGSGGSFFLGGQPENLIGELRRLEDAARNAEYETEINTLLGEVLAEANDRDASLIREYLDQIKSTLDDEIDGVVDLMFGGSVSKHTYVEGLSDVDALVVLNDSELSRRPPDEVVDFFLSKLKDRTRLSVEKDGFAIGILFGSLKVELIPVIQRGDDYLLPDQTSKTWSMVRPRAFTSALTEANQACNGKVVPVVKLAKLLMSALPESRRLSGYHTEAIAVEVFKEYKGRKVLRDMVQHFFMEAPEKIRTPMRDKTGQSRHIDDHLGSSESAERLIVADAVDRIGRRLRNADGAQSIDQWKLLLGFSS